MDLNAALILVRIVDKGSFTAAAQELGMTKATVSRRIAELEQRLGARLLYRSTRQLTLTEAGEQYYLRCSKAVEELAQAELMLSASQQEVTGTLKLAVPIETGQLVVGRLVANFLQAYPGMKVELELTNRIVDPISEGLDAIVRVGDMSDSNLAARRLWSTERLLCASPDYLARFGYPQSLEDLADHALIHYASTLGVRPPGCEVMIDGAVRWVKTGGILTVNSTETYQAACIAGLGIIQVPRTGVREALRAGDLIEILPQYRAEPLPVSLIYPHRRNLSRRVNLFMEWLGGLMKAYVD